MKENKNIERLFQEKFKQFEALPPPAAWQNIEARLHNKKKRRIALPLWLKYTGIAASLLISGLIGYQIKSNAIALPTTENAVVGTENTIISSENDSNSNSNLDEKSNGILRPENVIIVEQNNKSQKEAQALKSDNKNNIGNKNNNLDVNTKNSEVIANSDSENSKNQKNINSDNKNNIGTKNNNLDVINKNSEVIANSDSENSKNQKNINSDSKNNIGTKNNNLDVNTQNSEVIANSDSKTIKNQKNINSDSKNNIGTKNNNLDVNTQTSEVIANSDSETIKNQKNINSDNKNNIGTIGNNQNSEIIADSNSETENNIRNKNNTITSTENKKYATKNSDKTGVLTENKKVLATQLVEKDSTNVLVATAIVPNALELLLLQNEDGKNADEKEERRNKWAVSTHATAIYFNAVSNGSSLDEQFNENTKSFNTSLGYGLGLQYQVTKRFAISTGISNLELNYNTNDVNYKTEFGSVSKNVSTISRSQQGQNIVLSNKNTVTFSNDVENFSQSKNAVLNQKMGYIEVPVELNYKLIDRKVSVELVGGLSTLFLSSNSISLQDNASQIVIGKANNLNPVHFSTNIGMGINYQFVKNFNFNFQPMFKYQLNALNTNEAAFKPYYIGLNSGISFSF